MKELVNESIAIYIQLPHYSCNFKIPYAMHKQSNIKKNKTCRRPIKISSQKLPATTIMFHQKIVPLFQNAINNSSSISLLNFLECGAACLYLNIRMFTTMKKIFFITCFIATALITKAEKTLVVDITNNEFIERISIAGPDYELAVEEAYTNYEFITNLQIDFENQTATFQITDEADDAEVLPVIQHFEPELTELVYEEE